MVQGIESECSQCPLLHDLISELEIKCEKLQQQKSQLEVEKNKLEAEKKVFTSEHESVKKAIEFENAQLHQKNIQLEYTIVLNCTIVLPYCP